MTTFKQGDKVVLTDCVVEDTYNNMIRVKTPNNGRKTLKKEFVKHQQPKSKVSQAVLKYYEMNKDLEFDFNDWFDSLILLYEDEVHSWLYDNDYKTNQQRELAFATLIVNGPEAVEVEQEKEYEVCFKPTEQVLERRGEYGFIFVDEPFSGDRYFTKQELIDAGFGGVFDNEMFDVEEVSE